MKIVLESKDEVNKTVYAEVTEEGMKDFLAWFVAFRHAAQHGVHLTASGVGTAAVIPLQSSMFAEVLPAINGGK